MVKSANAPFFRPYQCSDCGSDVGFRSRRRTVTERYLLPLLMLQPVRCGECFRRDYRLIFVPVQNRLIETPRMGAKPVTRPNRNVA
jgi:hypothetical protein